MFLLKTCDSYYWLPRWVPKKYWLWIPGIEQDVSLFAWTHRVILFIIPLFIRIHPKTNGRKVSQRLNDWSVNTIYKQLVLVTALPGGKRNNWCEVLILENR